MSSNSLENHGVEHQDDDEEEFFDVPDASASGEVVALGASSLSSSFTTDREQLEKCGNWLLSIPRDDVVDLRKTSEYVDFLKAFDKLGLAHRRAYGGGSGSTSQNQHHRSDHSTSFLQYLAVDDVVLRVLEFLECQSLIPTSQTCSRFRELATQSATQRTAPLRDCRLLNHNVMKLLRAMEEMEGSSGANEIIPSVPVPLLGLEQRIAVTDAGDEEYNGVYYCTMCDGNGFVFTKPRNTQSRASDTTTGTGLASNMPSMALQAMDNVEQLLQPVHPSQQASSITMSAGNSEEPARPGQFLRCIIAKRFSNETILWYMSKEVETISTESGVPEISQAFSYWCKLMGSEEASLSLCRYPSQTSLLRNSGEAVAWQPLSSTHLADPPIVELLD